MSEVQTTLEALCKRVTSGGTPSRAVPEYFGGTIPWVKTGEVKKGFIFSTEECITELGLENSSAKLIPANSLIVAMYGDGDTAGNVAINKIPVTTNQACCNFVVDPGKADYRFLYYYLKGNYSNLVGLKLGGSQQNLNAATLKRFPVPVVSLDVQRKVVAILSAYDDLIANNQRRIALLESMAEEIYREWFVRMRFPGAKPEAFVQGLPQDWSNEPIGGAFKFFGGATPSKDVARYWTNGDVNWFTPTDITAADGTGTRKPRPGCARRFHACSTTTCPSRMTGRCLSRSAPRCTSWRRSTRRRAGSGRHDSIRNRLCRVGGHPGHGPSRLRGRSVTASKMVGRLRPCLQATYPTNPNSSDCRLRVWARLSGFWL